MESPQVAVLNEDIAELNKLLTLAVRENVKEKIKRCIENTTIEIAKLKLEESQTPNKITENNTPLNDSNLSYSSVQSFAWNQEGNKVTVFLTVKDIHNIDKDKICADFDERSFEIKMHQVNKKNYRFCVKKLHEKIVPGKCSFKIKKDALHVYLIKQDQKYWSNLHFKESPMSKIRAPKMDEQAEPSTMLMNMMKQLYQEGDSDMKRTIAKAWCEANEKKSEFSVPNF
ncbi:calcyclin binding protein, putative [Plasmodium knowlesi strain H]|uniref:Calcyclin binding protein, putative n=3 Tax=Plasmodium knowlesi TaxID=5850 RepID=A0A5K1VI69_PLAKH|nr:calcyclin binding protein, putative [Plasmodium knowlesi strain H]OTN64017.1 putative Calcyclin binding protein [Plasmodium knowlesi]CAA9991176.1 calcyclin binding protein, putative [Plasmodium knowlesi strain H]SBO27149.1 calcyclin binding protein, putative [Plasmodium knowlesi strain H]SBO29383.1 calcyclin binding protein, putative [Plasmodium knowlesi strain H]VVS80650.1 calcyclin binding protein, putative [Plasmodium knowlesi strain H]|eukprot:XP_002262468.1 Calcyclin binding protein, putative [Plasmodium knowlesi strain H]